MIPLSANPSGQPERDAALIAPQRRRLISDFGLHPYSASEIEFYLHGSSACADIGAWYGQVRQSAKAQGITIVSIVAERGHEQHEAALAVCDDPVKTARDTIFLKQIIADSAKQQGMQADFRAKPASDQPGSGLHIHVHLADRTGKNMFYKDDDRISDALKFSIGGLLVCLPGCMAVFAPLAQSYSRFTAGSNAPVTISWGGNNRTVALRLPDSAHDNKHIEHRVAGSDADPASVMALILAAMHYGMARQCDPGTQIYGDAALEMYKLPKLAGTLEEAQAAFHASPLVREYFDASSF